MFSFPYVDSDLGYALTWYWYRIVCPPPPLCQKGGLNVVPNFQKGGGFWQDLIFQWQVAGKEGLTFFRRGKGGCNFYVMKKSHCHCFLVCVWCVCVCMCVCLFGGRDYEKPIYRGIALKRRPWTACILFEKFRPETGGWMNLKNTLCTMPPLLVIRTLMP